MNTFCCPCGSTFRNTYELVYLSYPPKYLFRCDCCGTTRVLSEVEAYGNSRIEDSDRSPLLDALKHVEVKEPQSIL